MRSAFFICVLAWAAASVGVEGQSGATAGQRPAWMANAPLVMATLFAEGDISTPDDEMDTAFDPDGRTVYFTKTHMGQRLGVIVSSRLERGRWTTPEVAPFSGKFTDYDPFITADGSKLFFASNRPVSGDARKDFDLWMVERTPSGWGRPQHLGDVVNTPQDEFYPSVASDGTLYFSATRPDTIGRSDIYKSRWRDGRFEAPENLGPAINSAATEVDSVVAPDQSFIVFAGFGRPDDLGTGTGAGDLYVSRQVAGMWSPATPLRNGVNTPAREFCPALSPDGKYLFFTSFRGFGDTVPAARWTYSEIRHGLASVLNGFGNIYRVETSAIWK